ncbi:hypothetical protein QFZ20_003204 [Flavobacterium sp. W4I14]|nr:hypothetical protein [Flavobacterium sp. W4I14]
MKKIIFIINIFCALTFSSKAQGTLSRLTSSNVSDISNYISANYKLKEKNLDTLCLYTTVFAKFKVSNSRQISDLSLSANIPDMIKLSLEKAIKSSNGHWSNLDIDLEYFSNRIFVLPIVISYGRGCAGGDGELSLTVPVEDWRKIYNTARAANYAILDILKFNGKNLDKLECVLLAPLSLGDK